ncbi:MAG: hypothetical protein ACYC21_05300 [Eubacteriales bacterium]
MKKYRASLTAQGIAFARAFESRKPEGVIFDYIYSSVINGTWQRKEITKMQKFKSLNRLAEGYDELLLTVTAGKLKVFMRSVEDSNGKVIGYYEWFEKTSG